MSNTTRIAKNTLMLYFRQILIMLVSLYTVRVVLETLGAEDYGIYNVAAGLVVLFSFLNMAMTNATLRFLNYALGRQDLEQARDVYSLSLLIHALIAVSVIILAETAGLWFFFNILNIPAGRTTAALCAYQCTIVTTAVNILLVPWQASIIAYEKMSVFAFISIFENIVKLVFVFCLLVIPFDRLIVYSVLTFLARIIVLFIYKIYCNKRIETAHFRYCKNKELFRQLAGFSGWSLFGGFANICRTQGTNILINIFQGVMVNAAMGIATQVNTAVFQFVGNFQTAFNPQITKSYAAKEQGYFMRLIFQTSKMSFFLLSFFVVPLYINLDFVLQIWLKNVPEYTIQFTKLILVFSLVESFFGPLWMSIQATGNIKKYQIILSCFVFASLPLSLLMLWLGYSPAWVLIIRIILNIASLVWHIVFLHKEIGLSIRQFTINVLLRSLSVFCGTWALTFFVHYYIKGMAGFFASCFVSVLCFGLLIYSIGLLDAERTAMKNMITKKITGVFNAS
jgi:O-antigen/teichoic acid export membrane protein